MATFDKQNIPADGAWHAAQHQGANLAEGNYSIRPELGQIDYCVAPAEPTATESHAVLIPFAVENIAIGTGDTLFFRSRGTYAEVHVLD